MTEELRQTNIDDTITSPLLQPFEDQKKTKYFPHIL